MKLRTIIIYALFAAACGGTLHAQPGTAQAPASKIAIVDTDGFSDGKTGIKRLVAAYDQISREFKPRMDELQSMRTKYDALLKSIQDTQAVADPNAIRQKRDEAEEMGKNIQRKQEDGQRALDQRTKQLTDPIFQDVGKSLQAYAKQRGIDMVLDMAKLAGSVMIINDAMDITTAFINDYNASNAAAPAGVPVKTP